MDFNDDREKIAQAWEWLESEEVDNEKYSASFSHLWQTLPDDQLKKLTDLDRTRWLEAREAAVAAVQDGAAQ